MNKLVHIRSTSSTTLTKEIKPSMIYIPLEDIKGNVYKNLTKKGQYIFKGDPLAVNKKQELKIHSSVSGYVMNQAEKIISNGKTVKCIVVQNDYKEKIRKEKIYKKSNYTKEEFINSLKENGIVGLSGSIYPTYKKYQIDNIKYLLINAVECEPYVSCDKSVISNYVEEILETIDNIQEIMNIPKAIIVIKKTDISSYKLLFKYIGTYPNIEIYQTRDIYPNGWERILIMNTLGITYDKYPSEKGIIVNNVSTIYAIYEMLKYNKPLTERIITISGPGIKNKTNIKVKIGTPASDIIKEIGYKNIKNPLFIIGGLLNGNSLPTDDVVITKDVNSLFIIENNFEKSRPCIKCGKCMEVCPVNISPVLIMENNNNIKNLERLKPNKCIECGLCSYICPSKIEVREFVRSSKEKVNKDGV